MSVESEPVDATAVPDPRRLAGALAAMVILAATLGLVTTARQEPDRLEQRYPEALADLDRGANVDQARPGPTRPRAPDVPPSPAHRHERYDGRATPDRQSLDTALNSSTPPVTAAREARRKQGRGTADESHVAEEVASLVAPRAVSDSGARFAPQSEPSAPALPPRSHGTIGLLDPAIASPDGSAGRTPTDDLPAKASKRRALDGIARVSGPRQVAERFLAEQESLEGLAFRPATGYWSNTYLPGDPAIRLLEARLQRWDRSALVASLGDPRLEAAARQNRQPFDIPVNAALAAYLHGDKRAVDGRTRLRVQVGLQASQKRSGLRPDMNVGVVLDLRRPLDDATGTRLRALVSALARARQPGDRFSITVAGHPGGLMVPPESFRHGPIQVAMQSLFAGTRSAAPAMDLLAAMHTATESVRQGDDGSSPLGASLVLLVSTAPMTEQRRALERMAHENAVAGIGLSVFAVGAGADLPAIDHLVLLGQGHRRVLASVEEAPGLVDRELHAASRAVARAVRLRIRLAPGVELVDVIGSDNLSARAARRVREAERSIDRRMARDVGIRADRGRDEEGIQIVIPSFFAGDSHAVLLDVVVPGPGPVADVSVRYKDLVYRRNGVAHARLSVADGRRAPGPLERNVLKNRLTHEIAQAARAAGERLDAGDRHGTVRLLSEARDLIAGMGEAIPGWKNDEELLGDQAMLTRYLTVLGSGYTDRDRHRLADSLRSLAHRRLVPPHD